MEKRNDLIVGAVTTGASGHAERLAGLCHGNEGGVERGKG
jgi:hypothetical protein